ncbi:hypothetical protein DLAC_06457 [Tieghemostelium lacteum]|uniref:BTB domain-containing protein n=1 Tax=Tieghemostelium lacteum TaxID=361077 RepID=A0A151ZET7_TIELA|nr:hypothetical protein DLAC_06457 [Tieghemostelium lacteum]|eukprot:KYQ92473.1 hypothetical protein DLAC_06457 [Tieghemostelium lacteum]
MTDCNDFIVINNNIKDWIKLNVGGRIIHTTMTTLSKEPESMLNAMFKKGSTWNHSRDENGCILVDADPRYFLVLLNYLRHGELILEPNLNYYGVLALAKYFQIKSITDIIEQEENNNNGWITVLEDSFLDNRLDVTKWVINKDCTGSNFDVVDGRFKLMNRVYLVSKEQYNPEDGEIKITGTWYRESIEDFFQIATRSCGLSQGAPYYEVKSGLEFNYCRGLASIVGRGGMIPTGMVKIKKMGEFYFPAATPIHFEIYDDGNTVSFTLSESVTKTSITIETTCTSSSLLNYIAIHNREKTGNNHVSYVTNLKIQKWSKSTMRRNKYRKITKKLSSP